MSHLLRSHAPITEGAWEEIDKEARDRLLPALGARRLVDFSGPHGWERSASGLGRVGELEGEHVQGVRARQRRVLPLVELRAPFAISRLELEDLGRGAQDTDFEALDAAAARIAMAENQAVFHGLAGTGIEGLVDSSSHPPIPLGEGFEGYPAHVAQAVEMLLSSGVAGPYALALGPDSYAGVSRATERGYPLIEHLREIISGPLVWAPGLTGAALISTRGGDFLLECGQDLAVGYESHDELSVSLYIEESISFRVLTPEAAVALAPE